MLISEVLEIIERFAPTAFQAAWDNSGVQIASEATRIDKIALALDPTTENVARAVKLGANLLITHHPLLLEPRLPGLLDSFNRALCLAIKADMWLYAAHTSLDVQPHGPAGWLAREFRLADARVLEPTGVGGDGAALGFGLIGELPAPLVFEDFFSRLSALLPGVHPRLAGRPPKTVARLAYCPGSGAQLAASAKRAGADVFVTGDVRYHAALEAIESGLCLFDVGHFSLEEEMTRRLALALAEVFASTGPAVTFLPSTDPLVPFPAALFAKTGPAARQTT